MEKSALRAVSLFFLAWMLSCTAALAGAVTPEAAWIRKASALVGVAVEGTAPIVEFRGRVEASRRELRAIFLSDRQGSKTVRALHMQMLVLLSLLEAAATCHQAGEVSCPPELISRLIAQRNVVETMAGDGVRQ